LISKKHKNQKSL